MVCLSHQAPSNGSFFYSVESHRRVNLIQRAPVEIVLVLIIIWIINMKNASDSISLVPPSLTRQVLYTLIHTLAIGARPGIIAYSTKEKVA